VPDIAFSLMKFVKKTLINLPGLYNPKVIGIHEQHRDNVLFLTVLSGDSTISHPIGPAGTSQNPLV
jgi:hypothetical protein